MKALYDTFLTTKLSFYSNLNYFKQFCLTNIFFFNTLCFFPLAFWWGNIYTQILPNLQNMTQAKCSLPNLLDGKLYNSYG